METNGTLPAMPGIREMNLETYAANLQTKLQMGAVLLKSGMVPSHFKTPEAVVGAILYGQEVGFTPLQSLQLIFIVSGKPTVSAAGIQAKIIEAGGTVRELEHTDAICRLEITRGSLKREFSYSFEDAKKAGLTGKDNWQRMPKAMLYARAVSIGGRAMFADKIAGLNSTEEMQDAQWAEEQARKGNKNAARTIEVKVTNPEEVQGVVVADDLPAQAPEDSNLFQYDISTLAKDKQSAAIKVLRDHGATTEDDLLMLWESPVEVKKLAKFQVGGTDESLSN